ncbi:MAG: hypothetical protein KatS3mg131_1814 [Candidatus Tectimicrobiota bacterium]|nr:MAG: hypothetical protein KatS3mg131_1814 [Candidatus Tectomicrobia bacterium]
MLLQLHIRNYALIDELVVDFGPGFNVLTGETGAGKSMLIGALGLVLGQRAPADLAREEGQPVVVEALFDLTACPRLPALLAALGLEVEEPTLVLKRLLTKSGSRCYINTHLATVGMLQQVGQHLVDILGQHQHQALLASEQQLALLDAYGGLQDDVAALRAAYQEYQALSREAQRLQQEEQQRLQRQDLLHFQRREIDAAALRPGEDEALEQERHLLANAEKLFALAQEAYAALYGEEQAALEKAGGGPRTPARPGRPRPPPAPLV